MGNLFAELKRRHIYRVAAAYAVVAWVLLQLFNNLAPILKLPDWAGTLVLVLLIGGFPIILLFAWILQFAGTDGTTPKQATTRLDYVLAGGLAAVIAIFLFQQFALNRAASPQQQAGVEAARTAAASPAGISIAVLPFVNLSSDQEQEFFSDGMTDEITSALAKIPDLQIVGRSSAFQFKGQNRDVQSVGQALHASHLIEGSVRKAGDRVRITAQLIRADNGLQLWSENYDRQLTDIFTIQENIAQAIAASLQVPLGLARGDTLVRSRTKDEATYEDFLRAKALWRARGQERLAEAAKLLEQVVARDPNFAPAWALLSLTYGNTSYYHPAYSSGAIDQLRLIVEATLPKAEMAARRAIELDPKNPDAYIAMGVVQGVQWKVSLAQDLNARALALDPNNSDVLYINSLVLADLGYVKQAHAMVERLQKLEPLVPVFNLLGATIMWLDGQTDEPAAALKTLNPTVIGLGGPPNALARIYALEGRYAEAADALSTIPAGIYLPGTVETATRLLRTAPTPASSPQSLPRLGLLSWVFFHVGAADRILETSEDNLSINHWTALYPLWARPYASVRKTERFKAFVRKIGYVDYWRAHGWPDLCRPVGADDFVCD